MNYTSCPACSSKKVGTLIMFERIQLRICRKCDAIFGTLYRGEADQIVKPFWANGPVPDERLRYFDFEILSSSGVSREHGWYDRETGRVVQTG